jgi:hypothetical protein
MRRAWFRVGVVAAVVSAAVACSGSGVDEDAAVRPFAEVQDGPVRVEADPADPSRAVLRVRTSQPMICAVVWGPDDDYGRLNNSLAMNGTGILDHDVVLPDVEPGRTYRYVLQGTTADGTLYRSEPADFVIGDNDETIERPAVALGRNLAEDAVVEEASSSFSDDFAAPLAFDGDPSTEWSTRGDGDDAFVAVRLASPSTVAAVEFVTRSMADGSAVTQTFTVTVDGDRTYGPFGAGTPRHRRIHALGAEGTRFRFDVAASTGGNVGAVELRLYAPG